MIQTHSQRSEIMDMPYWEFEAYIERLNKRNKELADRQKKEAEEQKKAQAQQANHGTFNTNSFVNKFKHPKF